MKLLLLIGIFIVCLIIYNTVNEIKEFIDEITKDNNEYE